MLAVSPEGGWVGAAGGPARTEALLLELSGHFAAGAPDEGAAWPRPPRRLKLSGSLASLPGSSCGLELWEVLPRAAEDADGRPEAFDLLVDLGAFDSLPSRSSEAFCAAALEALRPGGLFLCASEEEGDYGSLRNRMRALRPSAGPRASLRPLAGDLWLHAYRKAEGEGAAAAEAASASASSGGAACGAQGRASNSSWVPEWAQPPPNWPEGKPLVELSRPNVNPDRILEKAMEAAEAASLEERPVRAPPAFAPSAPSAATAATVPSAAAPAAAEAAEWRSDAVDVALVPGRGRGLVVRRAVEAGELLMVLPVAFAAPAKRLAVAVAAWLSGPSCASVRARQQFYSLFDGANGGELPPLALFDAAEGACAGVPQPPPRPQLERT